MNLDEIISAINEQPGVEHEGHVTSPVLVDALAQLLGSMEPEQLIAAIQRLTAEVEKGRLQAINREVSKTAPFNEAMRKLHAWKQANAVPTEQSHQDAKWDALNKPK